MAVTVKTPQQLAEERKKLYQASLAQTTLEAQQQAALQRQQLNQQTRQQAINYNQALGAAQMQGYQRGNQIQQAFTQRGLGSSGLAQYGNIQNRQAMGQSINQLAGQNAEVARAAMDASRGISQNLQNTLMKARLQSDAQNVESDQMLYQQQMGEQDANYQRALEYMNVLGVDPTSEQGKAVLSQLFAGQLPADLQAQLESAANAPVDILGQSGVRRNMTGAGKASGAYLDFLSNLFGLGNNPKGGYGGLADMNLSYTIGGQKIQATSAKDAQEKITALYTNKPYIANGQIKVVVAPASGKVTFKDVKTGTKSNTYNDAVAKLTGSK